ncbi:MAG: hypothetical protein R3B46_01495 [Phycisphaerales bacterium]
MNEGGRDGERVREVLKRSINGEDEIAQFGRHVVTALLNSERRSDWETIGGLLLAAQRQEGLRQAILESVDEASPGGFRSMLGWVIEHDLARFSAVVRAFDVWFGMQWAGGSTKVVNDALKLCAYSSMMTKSAHERSRRGMRRRCTSRYGRRGTPTRRALSSLRCAI